MINQKPKGGTLKQPIEGTLNSAVDESIKPKLKSNSYFGVPSHKVKFSAAKDDKKKPFDPFPAKKNDSGKWKARLLKRRTLVIVISLVFILGMVSLTPVITGQTVLSAAEVQRMESTLLVNNQTIGNLSSELNTVKASLTASATANTKLQTEKTDLTSKLGTANSELGSLKTKLTTLEKTEQQNKDLEKNNYNLKEKVADLKDDLETLQDDYDSIVGNSARSICCKKKFDDSTITGYNIKNGKVSCVSSGGTNLDCSFS